MTISEREVLEISRKRGFNPIMIEKVLHLLRLLQAMNTHPFLKGKWVLKGGTALNLFLFNLPRLSVDIDLNYIGELDREKMLDDRPNIEQACHAVFSREGFTVKRVPTEHAGGKWRLSYTSYTGQSGNLEVDFNFMYRQPLWKPALMDSIKLGAYQAIQIPVLEKHELTAGKLAALLARTQVRDLYDTQHIFDSQTLDTHLLRTAFVVYGGMNRLDWRTISLESVTVESQDIGRKLLPVLHGFSLLDGQTEEMYGKQLVDICRRDLQLLLSFTEKEQLFLNMLLDEGIINASLLTDDLDLQKKIQEQPLLHWKILNVKKNKCIK